MSNRPNRRKLCAKCGTFPRSNGYKLCGPCKIAVVNERQEQLRRAGEFSPNRLLGRSSSLARKLRGDR